MRQWIPVVVALGGVVALAMVSSGTTGRGPRPPGGRVEPSPPRPPGPPPSPAWLDEAIGRVIRHEGGYTAINPNRDAAGVSLGAFQWSQRGGGLLELLDAIEGEEPGILARTLGPSWQTVRDRARARDLAPVDGATLWAPAWLERWRALLAEPAAERAQRRLIVGGTHYAGAVRAAGALPWLTPRIFAILLDTAVQQGASRPLAYVRERGHEIPAAWSEGGARAAAELLAGRAAAAFWSATARATQDPALQWKRADDGGYHLWRGSIDLYKDVHRRRVGLARDPDLSDHVVDVPGTSSSSQAQT